MTDSPFLKVAILPLDIVYDDIAANLAKVADGIRVAADKGVDILALPELFSTGFITDKKLLYSRAESGKDVISVLLRLSADNRVVITGSCLTMDGDRPVNCGFIILPDGRSVFYKKRHLFCLSPEHELVKAGNALPPVIEYKGWNLSLIVCYDLRFPAWCRNNIGKAYDVMFVPANWPKVRYYAWKHLIIARAIENQAYVVGVNRSGSDRFGDYDNTSLIVDPLGYPVSENSDGLLIATLSRENIEVSRTKLPASRDADTFVFPDIE